MIKETQLSQFLNRTLLFLPPQQPLCALLSVSFPPMPLFYPINFHATRTKNRNHTRMSYYCHYFPQLPSTIRHIIQSSPLYAGRDISPSPLLLSPQPPQKHKPDEQLKSVPGLEFNWLKYTLKIINFTTHFALPFTDKTSFNNTHTLCRQ